MTWRNRGPETEAAFKVCLYLAAILFAAVLYALATHESQQEIGRVKVEMGRELAMEAGYRARVGLREVER